MSYEKDPSFVDEHIENRKIDLAHNVNAKYVVILLSLDVSASPTHISLTTSSLDRIQNPLHGISHDHLLANVDEFTEKWGFQEDKDVFRRGALVAQNPAHFETIDSLTEDDKYHLRRETTRKLKLSFSDRD